MFAGFQTWGSAKGDKNTFGYSKKKTPEYILLEGAENNGELCNWLTPWSPSIATLSGETWKTKQLVVNEGTPSYVLSDSFDVDFGLDSSDDKGNTMSVNGQKTLNKFIEAYNFVYMHTINLLPYKETYSLNDPRNTSLDITKKYYITSINYQDNTYFRGAQWDVFRYDKYSMLWVPAGLPVLNDDGSQKLSTVRSAYNTDVYEYETFNLKKFHEQLGTSGVENINTYIEDLKTDFKNKFGTYFHVEDIIYHQAFIRLFAGTDNRAKNTYFKLFNKDCKIQLLQDDMDTILATDNRGLQKKPYFLLEPSLESDKTYKQMWGGSSAFFELVDITYKDKIDDMLSTMLLQMKFGSAESSLDTWMTQYFYYVQKYYPAVTYNYVSRLAYECAQIFFDNQKEAGVTWVNNGQTPVSQEHGSCLESEIAFMRKRLTMFLSQARIATFGREGAGIPIKVKEDTQDPQTYKVRITPYQYLYLGYLVGSVSNLYVTNRVSAGETVEVTISLTNDASYYVLGGNYIQRFDNFNQVLFNQGDYSLSAPKLLEFSANTGSDSLPLFQPPSLTLNCNVLEKLDLTNVRSLTTINLDSKHTPKLKEVILTGTNIATVALPTGSRLTKIHYPAALTSLVITDNEGLQEVRFESLNNLETVDINCAKVGQFDISNFCEQLITCPSLKSVTLRNLNNRISLKALEKLVLLQAKLTGKLTIANSDNELEGISYNDKVNLVSLYGNIDSQDNSLYINYKVTTAYNISCETEISVYGQGYSGNPFGLSLDGNNVALITERGKVIPDITYRFNSDVSDVATINNRTGVITLKTASSSKTTTATITVKLTNGNTLTSGTINIYFAWRAPELGNFVYADGTYSSAYMPSKTLMGLIFAINKTSLTEGTAYIVGKEYLDPQYVGYSDEANQGASDDRKDLYNVKFWLNSQVPGLGDTYYTTKGVTSTVDADANQPITLTTFKQKIPSTFTGKEDTQAYVNNVNTTLLRLLVRTYPDLIQATGGSYSITTKENLDALLANIPNISNQHLEQMQCLLYPYFYETYLYEPTVTEEEKNTQAFQNYFSKGKWYVPSYQELATLIYYRGYSAAGNNFSTGDIPIKSNISDAIPKESGDLKNPIFSTAYKNAGNYMPTAWNTLADSNNLCTNTDATCHNYTYQEISNYSVSGYEYSYQWIPGSNDGNTGMGIQGAAYNGWRLLKHKPLPCAQFNYQQK